MKIPFVKMQGTGNDFVLIDCLLDGMLRSLDYPALSRTLCDRRFGIGADQVLLVWPSETADVQMKIFNADGSEVEMCGNGIRCLARYLWDRGFAQGERIAVETAAGIIRPEKAGDLVRVNMGEPVLDARQIPVNLDGQVIDYPLQIEDRTFRITCVSMGNPHAVILVNDLDSGDVTTYGPLIERHELFPKRVNVEFVRVAGPERLEMRVWERGSGETLACGTGASAAAVAANLLGAAGRSVQVSLRGGDLGIEWQPDNRVFMTGPAEEVFEGTITLKQTRREHV